MRNKIDVELVAMLSGFHVVEYLGIGSIKAYLLSKGIQADTDAVNMDQIGWLIDKLKGNRTRIVGFTTFSNTIRDVLAACRAIKEQIPDIHISLGGPQVNTFGMKILRENIDVDSVVEGEGEITFYRLVKRLYGGESLFGCRGVVYRDENGDVVQNEARDMIEKLDELPYPDRKIFEQFRRDFAYISGGRGCMGNCSFCSESASPVKNALRVRNRSAESIVDEMEALHHRYGLSNFYMTESTFDDPGKAGREKATAVYRQILARKLQIGMQVYTRADRVDRQSEEGYKLGRQAGLHTVYLGIESGNERDLSLYRKRASVSQNYDAIRILKNLDIHVICGFICFNPYSDFHTLEENADFLFHSSMGHSLFLYMTRMEVFPQSAIAAKLKRDGLLDAAFDYQGDGYNYRFLNPKVGLLLDALMPQLDSMDFDLDNKLSMEEKWLKSREPDIYRAVRPQFQRIDEIRRLRLKLNDVFFRKVLNMTKKCAGERELQEYCVACDLHQFDDEMRAIFLRVYKEKVMMGKKAPPSN